MNRMRAISRATEVPLEPFAVWLDHKAAEFRTQRAMADMVAVATDRKPESVMSLILNIRKRHRKMIRRETVELFLGALGGNSEYERQLRVGTAEAVGRDAGMLGELASDERITFEDLYGPYVRNGHDRT